MGHASGDIADRNGHAVTPFCDLSQEEIRRVFFRPEYLEIIATPAFERLKEIRFLGAIDYLIVPNGSMRRKRHTRYQHSLRVAQLAMLYAHQFGLRREEERALVIAGLLHDAGHAPLSHSLEPAFSARFGMNHHSVSAMIIHGKVPLGSALPNIFRKYRISADEILALIEGTSEASYGEAFGSPINLDTIEAITRSYTYLEPDRIALSPDGVVSALQARDDSDIAILDQFWLLKDFVYNQLINNEFGLLADHICQKYMGDNPLSFWKGSFLQSEPAFRRQHGKLFDLLRSTKMKTNHGTLANVEEIVFKRRRFFVDTSVVVRGLRDLHRRYKQTKVTEKIVLGK
jgi:hypothetical protein